MNTTILKRMEILNAMNNYICNVVGDEDIWGTWIILVPDECTISDLTSIAEDDESWSDVCRLFAKLTKMERYN